MAARAAMAWEASLDPALVARLARPLRRPGLVSLAVVRRIHGGIDALLGRLALLARFAHKVRALAVPETPIVHARSIGAASLAAASPAAASAPVPVVRAIERTVERMIVVERWGRAEAAPVRAGEAEAGPVHAGEAAPVRAGEAGPVRASGEVAGAAPVSERRELVERRERREPGEVVPPRGATAATTATDPIGQTAPAVRRSRMGAPIVRRTPEPGDPPALVERVEPARASAEAPRDAAPAAIPAMKPREARPATATPASASGPSLSIVAPRRSTRADAAPSARSAERANVVVARRSIDPPAGPPIVHAAASRAPAVPAATASAMSPVVPPRPRAARPELALPLAHTAQRVQAAAAEAVRAVPAAAARAPIPLPAAHREPAAPPPPPAPKLDLHEIADHVQTILARRAMQVRERRGLPR